MTNILLGNAGQQVSTGTTLLFACLLVGLIVSLALEEKLHAKKSVIAGTFAIICLLLGAIFQILPFEKIVIGSHELQQHSEIDGAYEDAETGVHEVHIPAASEAAASDQDGEANATALPAGQTAENGRRTGSRSCSIAGAPPWRRPGRPENW